MQHVFQFPSPSVSMLAFVNTKWLTHKMYTSAWGYHFRYFSCAPWGSWVSVCATKGLMEREELQRPLQVVCIWESFLTVIQTSNWAGQRRLRRFQGSRPLSQEFHRVLGLTMDDRALWLTKHQLWASGMLPEQENYKGGEPLSSPWVLRSFCKDLVTCTLCAVLWSRSSSWPSNYGPEQKTSKFHRSPSWVCQQ